MMKGLEYDQIQYLMVFLKENPIEGIDEFQRKFINNAACTLEGSGQARPYRDFIGADTKVKVLITGEINLNEKNVQIGLKLAFPEWEFELYPMNIQKLIMKDSKRFDSKEAGVIATVKPSINREGVRWGSPCVFDPSMKNDVVHVSPMQDEIFPDTYTHDKVEPLGIEEQANKFKDIWTKGYYKEETSQAIPETNDLSDLSDLADDYSLQELFNEITSDGPDSLESASSEETKFKSISRDSLVGADSKEILEYSDSKAARTPFADIYPEDKVDHLKPKKGIRSLWPFNESDDTGNVQIENEYEDSHNDEDFDGFDSQPFYEPDHGFEVLGVVEERQTRANSSHSNVNGTISDIVPANSDAAKDRIFNLSISLVNKIKELPTKKISKNLLILGAALLVLSFGVTLLEPDYEASRKAAGVADIYEWIIANEMIGGDTKDVFELWKASEEFDVFWSWFDREWSPKINVYNKIMGGLRTTGGTLSIAGILVLAVTLAVQVIPLRQKEETGKYLGSVDKRISLGFNVYNDVWAITDTWVKENGYRILEIEGPRRLYRKRGNLSHPPVLCLIASSENQVQLEVWMSTWIPPILIPVLSDLGINVLESKNAFLPAEIKEAINALLLRLGQPPLA